MRATTQGLDEGGESTGATRSAHIAFAVLLALVFALSLGARAKTFAEWMARPERYFAQGVAASSTDSYFWFRSARELASTGELPGERDPLRAWPEGLPRGPVPAFAWLIARSAAQSGHDVYRTGIVLNVVLSSVFIVPLGIWARGIGLPLAGVLAGFFGGLGRLYVQRTSVHRVDTDGGTLFFLCLLALAIGSLRPDASRSRNLVLSALSGLTLAAFVRWYGQPGFWLVYLGTFALALAAAGFAPRETTRLSLVFALFANPLSALPGIAGLLHFLQFYVRPVADATPSPLDYASITRDITELQPLPLAGTLANVVDLPVVTAVGLAGFAALALRRWRRLIPVSPIALLGLYALVGPQRFGVFLGPLVGLGFGFGISGLASAYHRARRPGGRWAEPAAIAATAAVVALLLPRSGFVLDPQPSIPAPTLASLQRLATQLPDDAALLASWGNGYLLADVTGAATFTDGEHPDPIVHHLFTRAIASRDPAELHRIVATLSTHGQSTLHAALDAAPTRSAEATREPSDAAPASATAAALEALLAREATTAGNVVLVLMGRDLAPFPAFFRSGRWDFARGEGPEEGYDVGACQPRGTRYLRCVSPTGGNYQVDRAKGRVSGDRWLRRIVEIDPAGPARVHEHAEGAEISLQLIPDGSTGNYHAYLLPESVFESNFNQLYFLGRFDSLLFEEIHRDLPRVRAYRVRATAPRDFSSAAQG